MKKIIITTIEPLIHSFFLFLSFLPPLFKNLTKQSKNVCFSVEIKPHEETFENNFFLNINLLINYIVP